MSGAGPALPAAVIDSSALMSVLMGEAAAPLFMTGFQATEKLYIGAATRAETWLAAFNSKGLAGAQLVESLLLALQVETVDSTNTPIENAMVQLGYALSEKGVPLPKQD